MRVLMREVVDLDHIDDLSLRPLQRISVGIQLKYRETRLYKYNYNKRMEKEYHQRMEEEEKLKARILRDIYSIFKPDSQHASEMQTTIVSFEIHIERNLEPILKRILNHKDFMLYDLRVKECNRDILLSFPRTPIKLEVHHKFLEVNHEEA